MTQAAEWIGPVGDSWAAEWHRTDRSFADLAPHLDAAARDAATSNVVTAVDIGCGAGATSIALALARPGLRVTGIDLSPELIAVARTRSAGLPNLAFVDGPVQHLVAHVAPVDLFVSRHGVMFFADPVAAFTALRTAAAPGARLLFTCFRELARNPWAAEIVAAIHGTALAPPAPYTPGPFAFADPAFVRSVLAEAGWVTPECRPIDFTYRAGAAVGAGVESAADALSFFSRIGPAAPALRTASPEDRAAMLVRVAAIIARYDTGTTVDFPAAAWLWSTHAPA